MLLRSTFQLVVSMFVVVSVATRSSTFFSPKPARYPWRLPRGGASGMTEDASYTAIGVIANPDLLGDTSSAPPLLQHALENPDYSCCLIVLSNGHAPAKLWSLPNDSIMLETLGMTCHVLETTPETSIQSILQGIQRRQSADTTKLKLLVVLPPDNATDELREQLVLQDDWKDITPRHVDALELESIDKLGPVWDELISVSGEGEALIDQEGLVPLIKAVYESLSNKPCSIQPIVETTTQQQEVKHETTKPEVVKHHSESPADIIQTVVATAQLQTAELQAKLEDVWLNSDSVPMLEFGTETNAILQHASDVLNVPSVTQEMRLEILLQLASSLKPLYDQQLQSLQEHYGRRYEHLLETFEDPNEWTLEASRVTEAFRAAAQHAIPNACREEGELVNADFSYVATLQGLIADMMEATSAREELKAAVAPDEEEAGEEEPAKPRVAKWYEKVAARAAVLAVNYLQGWLAWQAIQRAAIERDRDMPKFPLF